MNKIIYFVSVIFLILSIFMTFLSIRQQGIILENQVELKEIYLDVTDDLNTIKQNVISNNQEYIEKYITNQKFLLDNWWNTIFNQSGLSIIVTLIVLLITITIGMINKSDLDKTISKEMENIKKDNLETISDITLIFSIHKGTSIQGFNRNGNDYRFLVNCINSFSKLKKLKREDFKEIYEIDISDISENIIADIYNKNNFFDKYNEIEKVISCISEKEDRKNVINKIEIDIKAKQMTYPPGIETRDNKIKEDNDLLNYVKSKFC